MTFSLRRLFLIVLVTAVNTSVSVGAIGDSLIHASAGPARVAIGLVLVVLLCVMLVPSMFSVIEKPNATAGFVSLGCAAIWSMNVWLLLLAAGR